MKIIKIIALFSIAACVASAAGEEGNDSVKTNAVKFLDNIDRVQGLNHEKVIKFVLLVDDKYNIQMRALLSGLKDENLLAIRKMASGAGGFSEKEAGAASFSVARRLARIDMQRADRYEIKKLFFDTHNLN